MASSRVSEQLDAQLLFRFKFWTLNVKGSVSASLEEMRSKGSSQEDSGRSCGEVWKGDKAGLLLELMSAIYYYYVMVLSIFQ